MQYMLTHAIGGDNVCMYLSPPCWILFEVIDLSSHDV